jgi:hypothetical protein
MISKSKKKVKEQPVAILVSFTKSEILLLAQAIRVFVPAAVGLLVDLETGLRKLEQLERGPKKTPTKSKARPKKKIRK